MEILFRYSNNNFLNNTNIILKGPALKPSHIRIKGEEPFIQFCNIDPGEVNLKIVEAAINYIRTFFYVRNRCEVMYEDFKKLNTQVIEKNKAPEKLFENSNKTLKEKY